MSKKKKFGNYKENQISRSEEARTVRRIVAIILISLILILVVGGISGYKYIKSALEPVDPTSEEDINVEIPMGSSSSDIGSILEEEGVIKDARVFRFYTKFKNESDFQAGEYTFTSSLSIDEVIESLKNGKVLQDPVYTITIPEGLTVDQMAGIFAEKLPIEKEDFIDRVNELEYVETLIDYYPSILSEDILSADIKTPLEGYLFAATYDIYEEEPSIDAIVEMMLNQTEAVLSSYMDNISAQELTVHEAVTMASLVEKEAGSEEQRKSIAGVFYNRLEIGMPLQTDPTVLYALGEHKDKVLLEDLEIESPYNTYHVASLPIGPIANFGESSLVATINPEQSDYIYFLHDEEGNIHYSETLQEHNQLKNQHIN
ncbi:endolytic transglycosylase MltG [Virgibacillus byunsanensis]|uniref:Endolytic murein transglycosylase n=1 Tax=Virgibacillus byunsanensis TaxID=570945 RepID=A0ABW3LM64_9BACI